MSIETEIVRISDARDVIRDELLEVGLVNSDTVTIDKIAEDILEKKPGLMHGAVSVEVLEGRTYTIPAGFHNGSGTVTAVTDEEGDKKERYKRQSKTVTPTKSQQGIGPDEGYYALESVTVNPIPDKYKDVTHADVTVADVLSGVKFVGATGLATGTMTNNGAVSRTLDTSTTSYTIPTGYHNGSGKVSVTTETKTATPTKATQDITPTSGKVLSKVTVNPIPAAYQDVTGVTTTADKVLEGSNFVDANGNVVEGTMADHSDHEFLATHLCVESYMYSIPEGYHDGKTSVNVAVNGANPVVTPTKEEQIIVGETGTFGNRTGTRFLEKVIVNPIPAKYQDVTPVTVTADKVLKGSQFVDTKGNVVDGTMPDRTDGSGIVWDTNWGCVIVKAGYHNETESDIPAAFQNVTGVTATAATVLTGSAFVDKTGALVSGTMANNGSTTKTFDGLATTSVTIPSGYTSGGTVSLTNDIETALAAI